MLQARDWREGGGSKDLQLYHRCCHIVPVQRSVVKLNTSCCMSYNVQLFSNNCTLEINNHVERQKNRSKRNRRKSWTAFQNKRKLVDACRSCCEEYPFWTIMGRRHDGTRKQERYISCGYIRSEILRAQKV